MAVINTTIVPNPGGKRLKAGQHFHFTLEGSGPIPQFTFASSVDGLLESSSVNDPQKTYEWTRKSKQQEGLDLTMLFLTCKTYEYKVEIHNAQHTVVETILHKTYEGDPRDRASESFIGLAPKAAAHVDT
jgi:hypothetical protein